MRDRKWLQKAIRLVTQSFGAFTNVAASKVFANHLAKTRPQVVVCDEFDGLYIAIVSSEG
jgi:hypothetical protein